MRSPLPIALLLLLALPCHGQSDGSTTQQPAVKELEPAQLATLISSDTVFIYDCNESDMFAEAHVPGAVLVVYDAVTADQLPVDHQATLVFYCYSPECPAGAAAAHTAVTLGYVDVYCMKAGITGWQDAGLATQP